MVSDAEMFRAMKQYEELGEITQCKSCQNYNPKNSSPGYGVCSIFGRMMKDSEFCCYGKEKTHE